MKKEETPMLAILTLNYNSAGHTINFLKSLEKSEFKDFKIFIVNNPSNDDDLLKLQCGCLDSPLNTKIVYRKKNEGWGAAINDGFKKIHEEGIPYTLVVNNDATISSACISELFSGLNSDQHIMLCGPKILNPEGGVQTVGGRLDWLVKFFGITRNNKQYGFGGVYILKDNETLDDCCWLLKSDIMKQIKYPEHIFLYFEELYIIKAIRGLGYKLAYVPSAIVTHEGQGSSVKESSGKSRIQTFYLNRNRILFVKDNYPKIFPLFLICCSLITVPLLIVKSILKRDFASIKQILAGYWSGIQYSLFGKTTYFKQ